MKFITWNVRYQNVGDDERGLGWDARRAPLCAVLREQKPAIFAVQEACAPQIDDLRAALPDYDMAGVGREDGARAGEFCAIFWRAERFDLRAQETRWLSPTPDKPSLGWGATCVRICTRARLLDRETGREFAIWNAHFDHRSALARLESARILRSELAGLELPAILCGDFNCAPDAPPIETLTEGDALRDARLHSAHGPAGPIATSCGFAPHDGHSQTAVDSENRRIDYVLVSADWHVETYATLPTDRHAEPVSDHRPVVVELQYQ